MTNPSNQTKIRSFTDLDVWKKAHYLATSIYQTTKTFPRDEVFGLISQLRRAAVSVSSNIAEGFTRESYPDKIRFYTIALGSLVEIQNQLLIARDVGYLNKNDFDVLADKTIQVHKLINGLLRKSRSIRDSNF